MKYIYKTIKYSSDYDGGTSAYRADFSIPIMECDNEGMRYIGWIPTKFNERGCIEEIELIFAQDEEPNYQKYVDRRSKND